MLDGAFGASPHHSIPFEKFYKGSWHLQPALGGVSTDLSPDSPFSGYLDIHYNSALQRYVMIISDDTPFAYAESVDGLDLDPSHHPRNLWSDCCLSHRRRTRR